MSKYSDKGEECLAPGCHRTDTSLVFPVVVVTKSDKTTDYGTQLLFRYCALHIMRPYEYENLGQEAPEITEAIKQWRTNHS